MATSRFETEFDALAKVTENDLTVAEELAIRVSDAHDPIEGPFCSAAAVVRALDIDRHQHVYGE